MGSPQRLQSASCFRHPPARDRAQQHGSVPFLEQKMEAEGFLFRTTSRPPLCAPQTASQNLREPHAHDSTCCLGGQTLPLL